MGISIAIIWASAFTAARILMINAPPFLVLSSRFFISGLLAITIAYCFGQKINFSRREWNTIISIGLCQNTVCTALNFTAMQWVTASIAAIIASMLPIIIAMFLWIFKGEEIGIIGKLGLFTGIAGGFLIVYDKTADETKIFGLVLCIVAVLGFAGAALLVGNSLKNNKNLFMIVGLQMIVGYRIDDAELIQGVDTMISVGDVLRAPQYSQRLCIVLVLIVQSAQIAQRSNQTGCILAFGIDGNPDTPL